MNVFLKRYLLKIPAPCIVLAIWILSSQETLPAIKGVLGWDKLQHLLAYAVLSAAAGLWFGPALWRRRGLFCLFLTAAIASAYGLIDELHQSFVPGRDSNVWDWMADSLGGLLGGASIWAALRNDKITRFLYSNNDSNL
jgi:VanZ family protein